MTKRGYLFDLGPDGLGFVRESDDPHEAWPISIVRHTAGTNLRDGMLVSFELHRGRVTNLSPIKPAAPQTAIRKRRKSA